MTDKVTTDVNKSHQQSRWWNMLHLWASSCAIALTSSIKLNFTISSFLSITSPSGIGTSSALTVLFVAYLGFLISYKLVTLVLDQKPTRNKVIAYTAILATAYPLAAILMMFFVLSLQN